MKFILLVFLLCTSVCTFAQYKNDNTLFKTVFIEDLCERLKSTPNAVIVDVRSKGEYEDTSTATSLNIGHLKSAIHLDIREMPTRWRELLPYKDQPVFIVCSHSQRSRRVSKMLVDSGFTNITNINGGLTTYNILANSMACKDQLVSANKYKFVSPNELCSFLGSNKDLFIVDLRNDSAYRGIITDERQNLEGTLKGSVNIPYPTLATSLDKIPKNKKVLLIDDGGNESAKAAAMLAENGYTDLYVLFNGLDMLLTRTKSELPCVKDRIVRTSAYQPVSVPEFYDMVSKDSDLKILDVRTSEEFANKSQQAFRNIGHIKNAVNIPLADLQTRATELEAFRNKPIVVHSWAGGNEAFKAARYLTDNGFKKVYVLPGGIFAVRWQAANYKGKSHLASLVVDVPVENQ